MRTIKQRAFKLKEMRLIDDNGKKKIRGHAAVFNQLSEDLGYFREMIKPGAFTKTIQEADVRALFNHDPNIVLGRTKSNTLSLREDDIGLWFEIDPPNTTIANDLLFSIDRGDIDQASFGFEIINEKSEVINEETVYIVTEVRLWDVSPVTFPAYPQTDVSLNSVQALNSLELRLRRGAPLQDEDKEVMQRLLELLTEHLSNADENHIEGRSNENASDDIPGDDIDSTEPDSDHSEKRKITVADMERRLDLAERFLKLQGG